MKLVKLWLPFAVTITLVIGVVYGVTQQSLRQSANNNPAMLANDAVEAIKRGNVASSIVPSRIIHLESDQSAFVSIYDKDFKLVATSARLVNDDINPPQGVLEHAKSKGENKVTWQPKDKLRFATVTRYTDSPKPYYVFVGQSLVSTEDAISSITTLCLLGWFVTMLGSLGALYLSQRLNAKSAHKV